MNFPRPSWLLVALVFFASTAIAPNAAASKAAAVPPLSVYCVEANTGLVIFDQESERVRPPASMVKMMMMLLISEGVDAGRLRLTDMVTISDNAQRMGGTQLFLKSGDAWSIGDLSMALAIASANDAAMALAEGLWGSVEKYLEAANARAVELGMNDTVFRSPHGLPPDDRESFDFTTARDMSRLALACLRHPRIMEWSGVKEHTFRPGHSARANTNKLLWRMPEADGLKTGYIRAAGFCVTATAERDGVRLVCVVMGASSVGERFRLAQDYLERAFNRIERIQIVRADQGVGPIDVRLGMPNQLLLNPTDDLWVTVLREDRKRLEVWAEHPRQLTGPLSAGTTVGEVQVVLDGTVLATSPLVVPTDVEARGWMLTLDNGVARWIGLQNPPLSAQ